MRVEISRAMAVAVAAVTVSALSGCTTMGKIPGSGYVTSWWKSPANDTYASTPAPSEQSTPIVAVSQGNASSGPVDIANRQYGPTAAGAQAGGYPTQPAGAIQPNYANPSRTPSTSGNPYAEVAANHGYQPGASTQVTPANQPGTASLYGNTTPQANPYSDPYGGYQTADARNNAYGSAPAAGSTGSYGNEAASPSSIQPYSGYQGSGQPYGNPTPPPSYTPPANTPNSGYGPSSYGAATPTSPSTPMQQPPAEGYKPFNTGSYAGPAEVENLDGGVSEVAPAGYQGGSAPADPYGATPYGNTGGYQPSSQPLY